jgi:hypothetical protein
MKHEHHKYDDERFCTLRNSRTVADIRTALLNFKYLKVYEKSKFQLLPPSEFQRIALGSNLTASPMPLKVTIDKVH